MVKPSPPKPESGSEDTARLGLAAERTQILTQNRHIQKSEANRLLSTTFRRQSYNEGNMLISNPPKPKSDVKDKVKRKEDWPRVTLHKIPKIIDQLVPFPDNKWICNEGNILMSSPPKPRTAKEEDKNNKELTYIKKLKNSTLIVQFELSGDN